MPNPLKFVPNRHQDASTHHKLMQINSKSTPISLQWPQMLQISHYNSNPKWSRYNGLMDQCNRFNSSQSPPNQLQTSQIHFQSPESSHKCLKLTQNSYIAFYNGCYSSQNSHSSPSIISNHQKSAANVQKWFETHPQCAEFITIRHNVLCMIPNRRHSPQSSQI